MSPVRTISPLEVDELLEQGAFLLDVREDDEWASGRDARAHHIRLSELPDHLGEIPSDTTIVCVCRVGGRSLRAAEFLDGGGFVTCNVEGGMLGWETHGLPLIGDDNIVRII